MQVGDIDADLLKAMGLSKQGHISKLIKNASLLRVVIDGAQDYSENPVAAGEVGGADPGRVSISGGAPTLGRSSSSASDVDDDLAVRFGSISIPEEAPLPDVGR